jgi:hypothetical protein
MRDCTQHRPVLRVVDTALSKAHYEEADESRLAEIARRHSMEIVGPMPESYV